MRLILSSPAVSVISPQDGIAARTAKNTMMPPMRVIVAWMLSLTITAPRPPTTV